MHFAMRTYNYRIKSKPFKHLFSSSNFTSKFLLIVLEHSDFKPKQLRGVLAKYTSTELMLKWLRLA